MDRSQEVFDESGRSIGIRGELGGCSGCGIGPPGVPGPCSRDSCQWSPDAPEACAGPCKSDAGDLTHAEFPFQVQVPEGMKPGTEVLINPPPGAIVPNNVVPLQQAAAEPEVVQFELMKDDVIRLFTGTPAPYAPGSNLVRIVPDLVRGTESPEWNAKELAKLPLQQLLTLYSDINWKHENPLGGVALLVPRR